MPPNTASATPKRRVRHRRCKHCGVIGTPDAPISSRGKCAPCGEKRMTEAILSLHDHEGETWDAWTAGILAGLSAATGVPLTPPSVDDCSPNPRHLRIA